MLRASSKRAFSSTIAETYLPARAARINAATIGLLRLVRYSACLIAITSGSSAASSINRTTGSNDS